MTLKNLTLSSLTIQEVQDTSGISSDVNALSALVQVAAVQPVVEQANMVLSFNLQLRKWRDIKVLLLAQSTMQWNTASI